MGTVTLGKGNQPGPIEVDAVVVDQVRVLVRVSAARAKPYLPLFFVDSVDSPDNVSAFGDLALELAALGIDEV